MNPENNHNELHIFRTNVSQLCENCSLSKALSQHAHIRQWTIDYEDIDCVLRVESNLITADAIISLLKCHGFECAELE